MGNAHTIHFHFMICWFGLGSELLELCRKSFSPRIISRSEDCCSKLCAVALGDACTNALRHFLKITETDRRTNKREEENNNSQWQWYRIVEIDCWPFFPLFFPTPSLDHYWRVGCFMSSRCRRPWFSPPRSSLPLLLCCIVHLLRARSEWSSPF